MKITLKTLSFTLMLIVFLSACSYGPAAVQPTEQPPLDQQALANGQWQVQSLTVNGQAVSLVPTAMPTIQFDQSGKATGNAGCNSFFADYTVSGPNGVSFSSIGSTKMACAEGMTEETQFLQALEAAKQASLADQSLELRSEDGQTIVKLVNQPAAVNPEGGDLAGTKWVLTQIENKTDSTVTSAPAQNVPTLEFSDDGKISGNGGCNGFGGNYVAGEGSSLKLTEIISTLMACDNTDIETPYFNALNEAESYSIVNDVLQITSSNGTVVLTFAKSAE
jgi:heat shock protein HslJ